MLTGVLSVVYPGVEPFLGDFLHSLATQNDQDFILFLINDGCADLDRHLAAYPLSLEVKEASGSPAALRKAGIAWLAAAKVELILFADADDFFASNRISYSKSMLYFYDIMCNELMLVGNNISSSFGILGRRFKESQVIGSEHIIDSNCLGFSNTSIRSRIIPSCIDNIPNDIIAFDWAFYSLCMHFGAKAVFTRKTQTYYRQHDNNIASLLPFSEEQILRGVRVKADHYEFLCKYDRELEAHAINFASLLKRLACDVALRQEYCQAVRRLSPLSPLWWEPIKTLEGLGL